MKTFEVKRVGTSEWSTCQGNTAQEAAQHFLRLCGVTPKQLQVREVSTPITVSVEIQFKIEILPEIEIIPSFGD